MTSKRILVTVGLALLFVLPGCRSAHVTSAILYIDQQMYDKAIDVLHEGLEYSPDEADAFFYLGEAHTKQAEENVRDNDYLAAKLQLHHRLRLLPEGEGHGPGAGRPRPGIPDVQLRAAQQRRQERIPRRILRGRRGPVPPRLRLPARLHRPDQEPGPHEDPARHRFRREPGALHRGPEPARPGARRESRRLRAALGQGQRAGPARPQGRGRRDLRPAAGRPSERRPAADRHRQPVEGPAAVRTLRRPAGPRRGPLRGR